MTVEWMKPRINSMIWNIRKKKTFNQKNKKKKESKLRIGLGASGITSNVSTFSSEGHWKKKRKSKKLKIYLKK